MTRRPGWSLPGFSRRTARRALPVAFLGLGQDGSCLALRVGGQAEPGFTGQDGHDGGELGGGIAREVNDGGKTGGQRKVSGEQRVERVFAARQDDSQFIRWPSWSRCAAVICSVQAAEQMLAADRQGVPGVRAGDEQHVRGRLDDLGDLGRGVPRGGTGQVGGGDLDQLPVSQQAQVLVQPGQGPGRPGLAAAGPPVGDQASRRPDGPRCRPGGGPARHATPRSGPRSAP